MKIDTKQISSFFITEQSKKQVTGNGQQESNSPVTDQDNRGNQDRKWSNLNTFLLQMFYRYIIQI